MSRQKIGESAVLSNVLGYLPKRELIQMQRIGKSVYQQVAGLVDNVSISVSTGFYFEDQTIKRYAPDAETESWLDKWHELPDKTSEEAQRMWELLQARCMKVLPAFVENEALHVEFKMKLASFVLKGAKVLPSITGELFVVGPTCLKVNIHTGVLSKCADMLQSHEQIEPFAIGNHIYLIGESEGDRYNIKSD
jgi:hypothetical protein